MQPDMDMETTAVLIIFQQQESPDVIYFYSFTPQQFTNSTYWMFWILDHCKEPVVHTACHKDQNPLS